MGVEFGVSLGFESQPCFSLFSLGKSPHSMTLSFLILKTRGGGTGYSSPGRFAMRLKRSSICKNTVTLQALASVTFYLIVINSLGNPPNPLHTLHTHNAYVCETIPRKMTICVVVFFQVSVFLKDRVQNSNGRFVLPVSGPVPWGTEVPGLIR